jgi:hypothetical protein
LNLPRTHLTKTQTTADVGSYERLRGRGRGKPNIKQNRSPEYVDKLLLAGRPTAGTEV